MEIGWRTTILIGVVTSFFVYQPGKVATDVCLDVQHVLVFLRPANYFFIRSELNGNVVEVRPSNRADSWLGRFVRKLKPSKSVSL